jgi:hypothetical protein
MTTSCVPQRFIPTLAKASLAILLAGNATIAAADSLGRLFYTPQQRAQIDFNYARNASADGNASPVLTVNGIVQKQGGARTVWINGVAEDKGKNTERNPTAQTVAIPGKSKKVKLKVGDKILLDQAAPSAQDTSREQ